MRRAGFTRACLSAALLAAAALLPAPSLACDYPGGPPGSEPVEQMGDSVIWAYLSNATDRYRHGVLGDHWEAEALRAMSRHAGPCDLSIYHEDGTVFEDVGPRLADVTGDGLLDIVVVESHPARGARLAVYGLTEVSAQTLSLLAATPHIGTAYRWLAPAGIADFDGDGRLDIAYVERPHLAGLLTFVTVEGTALVPMAAPEGGYSNHRIGEDFITGGVRDCGAGPEVVLPDFGWSRLMAARLAGGAVAAREIAGDAAPDTVARALGCGEDTL